MYYVLWHFPLIAILLRVPLMTCPKSNSCTALADRSATEDHNSNSYAKDTAALQAIVQGDRKVSVHLMITIKKVTSNVQSVTHQSPDIYWDAGLCSWRQCSVQHGPHSEYILWRPSSTHQLCGDCSNTLSFLISPQRKQIGQRKIRQGQEDTRLTLTPSVIPNSNYVIMVGDWKCLKFCIFCVFLYCNRQVDFLITLYFNWNALVCRFHPFTGHKCP
jgi:hypothetical protein